ncbi:MAG: cytochrome P460 family protein [Gammaproteobacteria bacterium]
MPYRMLAAVLTVAIALAARAAEPVRPPADAPRLTGATFTTDGRLQRPVDYRNWQFVTSGVGMSYGPAAQAAVLTGHVMFDNVFVQPEAYRYFLENGAWPDGTMFVLELRGTETQRPPNNRGYFQTEIHGVEVSVKDSKRFKGLWAYFDFGMDTKTAAPQPEAGCYACHRQSAAVDMTFVQFYPTLQGVKPARKQ